MKKVKLDDQPAGVKENKIEHYSNFKGNFMVKISGNFYKDLNLSKKKVQAILDNIDALEKFAAGQFDEDIKALSDGEVLQP